MSKSPKLLEFTTHTILNLVCTEIERRELDKVLGFGNYKFQNIFLVSPKAQKFKDQRYKYYLS
jgi:hypothetical protein